jgi:hypothetical protein
MLFPFPRFKALHWDELWELFVVVALFCAELLRVFQEAVFGLIDAPAEGLEEDDHN